MTFFLDRFRNGKSSKDNYVYIRMKTDTRFIDIAARDNGYVNVHSELSRARKVI